RVKLLSIGRPYRSGPPGPFNAGALRFHRNLVIAWLAEEQDIVPERWSGRCRVTLQRRERQGGDLLHNLLALLVLPDRHRAVEGESGILVGSDQVPSEVGEAHDTVTPLLRGDLLTVHGHHPARSGNPEHLVDDEPVVGGELVRRAGVPEVPV